MKKTVLLAGSLDTKGAEYALLQAEIRKNGLDTLLLDFGTKGQPHLTPDLRAEEVAAAAGSSLAAVQAMDAAEALDTMGRGAAVIAAKLAQEGRIHGLICMGGGQGTNLSMHCMRVLPVGFPKLLLSTLANVPHRAGMFSGSMDTAVMNSIVDISGHNSVLETVISMAASAISGMVLFGTNKIASGKRKKRVALSMLGVTTPCVSRVTGILEQHGVEAITFIANEQAGKTMEQMIRSGEIDCVADLTLAELTRAYIENGVTGCDGTQRLEAAAGRGIPMVVCPGGLDLCNLTTPTALSKVKFPGRNLHMHNSDICVLRTDIRENTAVGTLLMERLGRASGPVELLVPEGGISENDRPGHVFYDSEADQALFTAIRDHAKPNVQTSWLPYHINDPAFAEIVAAKILDFLK